MEREAALEHDGRVRRALCIAIPRFATDEWADLEHAAPHSTELRTALARFGYDAPPPPEGAAEQGLGAPELGAAVYGSIEDADGESLLVVAVLSHGLPQGVGDLYVIGADGAHTSRTRVGDWMKEVDHFSGPATLFLLDLCGAGHAAWPQRKPGEPARSWMVGASPPDRAAYDGRFTRAAATVLNRIADGHRDIHPSLSHVPLTTVAADLRAELNRLVEDEDGYEQTAVGGLVELCDAADPPPFFRNPGHRPDPLEPVRRRGEVPFLDDLIEAINVPGLDPAHFAARAGGQGHRADVPPAGCFTGRTAPLAELSEWMDGAGEGALRVVTGSPGAGKSALLGVLVCAAHPALREHTRHLWWSEGRPTPSEHDAMAVVHARQRDTAEVLAALAAQLSMTPAPADWATFADRLRDRGDEPLIVVDALDEAVRYDALTDGLLLLMRARGPDGSPVCRLLIGMRPWEHFAALREAAAAADGLLDLDERPHEEIRADVERYVTSLLQLHQTYRLRSHREVRTAFARAVAQTLTAEPATDGRWGAFLVAGLYTNLLTRLPDPIGEPDRAARFGRDVPRTLPDVLRLDLAARPGPRPVLTALSFARGDGMPLDLIEKIVPLFGGGGDVRAALDEAGFYLRQTAGTDGTTLYRLFHQGLTDELRDERFEERVFELIRPADWRFATPYAVGHAVQHAAAAGRLDELLGDREFLVHADPTGVLPHLTAAGGAAARRGAEIYRTSFLRHRDASPQERRQILAVDAARHDGPDAAAGFARGLWLRPVAATGNQVSPALLASLEPEGGAVVAVVPADDERPNVVVATEHAPPHEWDLRRAAATGAPLGTEPAGAVAVTTVVDRRVVIVGGRSGAVTGWDLRDGRQVGPPLTGHTGSVSAVVCIGPPERRIAVTGGSDGTVRRWDLSRMRPLRAALVDGNAPVTALLATRHDGHDAVAVATGDGWVSLWTPGHRPLPDADADLVETSLTPPVGQVVAATHRTDSPVRALLQGGIGDGVVLHCRDGALHLWNPATGGVESSADPCVRETADRPVPDAELTVCAFGFDDSGRPLGVSGTAGGMVRVAGAGDTSGAQHAGHGGAVTAAAFVPWEGGQVAVTGAADGGLRAWLPENAPESSAVPFLSGKITALVPVPDNPSGRDLASLDHHGRLLYWQRDGTETETVLCGLRLGISALAAATMHGHAKLIIGGPGGALIAKDIGDGRERGIAEGIGPVGVLRRARIRGNEMVLAGGREGEVRVVDLAEERVVLSLSTERRRPTALRMLPGMSGRDVLVALVADGGCLIWDLARPDLPPIEVGQGLPEQARATALDCVRLDRRPRLVTGGADGTLRVWDPQSGARVGDPVPAHSGPVTALECLTVEDRTLALSAGRDATLALTDLSAMRRIREFATPETVQTLATMPGTVCLGMGREVIRMALEVR